ncbi:MULTISPECIES: ATP-binding protein [unclassified Streptomyces]|uniref:ATP-binding protein n=1 Tax=unclassified Streptomyces TaxID=2593676 RepID=UPI002E189E19
MRKQAGEVGTLLRLVADSRADDSLIGREAELTQLRSLLAGHRLVTVTGPVGVGKSLLSDVAAQRSRPSRRQVVRVSWPEASGRPGDFRNAVRQALLSTPLSPDSPSAGRRTAPRVLLFLDDIDPVHDECVGVVQRQLLHHPTLRVLVTARRPLGLGDEAVLRLGPLPTEPEDDGSPSPAARLFLAAAGGALRHRDAATLERVHAVCHTLDGLPLSIGLAAAQLRSYSLHDLAELVEHGQSWLHSPRPRLRRHRSVEEAVGAVHTLCSPWMRMVWSRASILAGSFGEAAAVLLCTGGEIAPHQVPGLLTQLASLGLLQHENDPHGPGEPRYRMPPAVREFGERRLTEAGELDIAVERRAGHCRRVVHLAEHLWEHGHQTQALRLVADEQHNLNAILRYALTDPRPEVTVAALETATRLWFWWVTGHGAAGLRYLLQLLARCPDDHPSAAPAAWLAAWLAARTDPDTALTLLDRIWPGAVLDGDDTLLARIAHVHGLIALTLGDPLQAGDLFEQACVLTPDHATGGPGRAVYLAALAFARRDTEPRAAHRAALAALAQPGLRDDVWSSMRARYALALVDHHNGRAARAWTRAHRAVSDADSATCAPQAHAALRSLLTVLRTGQAAPDPVIPGLSG